MIVGQDSFIEHIHRKHESGTMRQFNIVTTNAPNQLDEILADIYTDFPYFTVGSSVDDIRELISIANRGLDRVIVLIKDGSALTIQAANALLKVAEETPKGVYIFMHLYIGTSTLNTLHSRADAHSFGPYPRKQLVDYLELEHDIKDENIVDEVLTIASNPDQIDDVVNRGVNEVSDMIAYAQRMVDNVDQVALSNFMKIAFSFDIRGDGNGLDFNYIITAMRSAWENIVTNDNADADTIYKCQESIRLSSSVIRDYSISSIAKMQLVDVYLIELWEVWNK